MSENIPLLPSMERQVTGFKISAVKNEMENVVVGSKKLIQLSLLPLGNPTHAHFNWLIKEENFFVERYQKMSIDEYREIVKNSGEFTSYWSAGN